MWSHLTFQLLQGRLPPVCSLRAWDQRKQNGFPFLIVLHQTNSIWDTAVTSKLKKLLFVGFKTDDWLDTEIPVTPHYLIMDCIITKSRLYPVTFAACHLKICTAHIKTVQHLQRIVGSWTEGLWNPLDSPLELSIVKSLSVGGEGRGLYTGGTIYEGDQFHRETST